MIIIPSDEGEYVRFEFALAQELLRQKFLTDPLEFFKFLVRFKLNDDIIICDALSVGYGHYGMITFRTMICELFYHAINCFEWVSSYTIHCKNNNCEARIIIGHDEGNLDDCNLPVMAKIVSDWGEYTLNYQFIYDLYISNKVKDPDFELINTIMVLLIMNGNEPKITTSYTLRKDIINSDLRKQY